MIGFRIDEDCESDMRCTECENKRLKTIEKKLYNTEKKRLKNIRVSELTDKLFSFEKRIRNRFNIFNGI